MSSFRFELEGGHVARVSTPEIAASAWVDEASAVVSEPNKPVDESVNWADVGQFVAFSIPVAVIYAGIIKVLVVDPQTRRIAREQAQQAAASRN